jgi:hypothetical protein
MRTRVALRAWSVGLPILLGLSLVGLARAAGPWNEVPFPSEYVEAVNGVDTYFLAHEFDPDRYQVAVDAHGDHWALTDQAVYRLPSGGDAWIEDDAGLDFLQSSPHSLGGASLYYDRDVSKLFLADSSGWFARGLDDTVWRALDTSGLAGVYSYGVYGYGLAKFGGYLWSVGSAGLFQMDPQAETLLVANDNGLPSMSYDTQTKLSNIVATDTALYVGVHYEYQQDSQPSSFSQAGVYKLTDASGQWVSAGLDATPLESELAAPPTAGLEWGVGALHATQGYVFASVYGNDWQANRLFVLNEAAGTWSLVPLPPEKPVISSGAEHYLSYYVAVYQQYPVWDAKLYSNPQPSYPNRADRDSGVKATFSVFDPASMAWQSDVTRDAVVWTPAIPADVLLIGDQIVVPRYHDRYYDQPLPEPQPEAETGTGFVESVPLPTQISTDPEVIGTNAALALFFALLFGVISTVFNSTLEENYTAVAGWFAPIARLSRKARTALLGPGDGTKAGPLAAIAARLPLRQLWPPIVIVLLSAFIYGFLDPAFGATLDGLGLFLSLAVAIGVTTLAYDGLQSVLSNRRFGTPANLQLMPAAIAIAVGCVLISRVMSFHPGYVFGIVGGLAFVTAVEPDSKAYGRMVLISAGAMLAVSLIAWFAAVPVTDAVGSTGGFWLTTLQAALISLFVMGLEALLFGLLPLQFMDGEKLMRWSKAAWVAAFGLVAFAFWHVLLNPGSKYLDSLSQKNVLLMFGLLVVYGLLTLVMFLYFRARSRKETPTVQAG